MLLLHHITVPSSASLLSPSLYRTPGEFFHNARSLTLQKCREVLLDVIDYGVRAPLNLQTLRQCERLQSWDDALSLGVDALALLWRPHRCGELIPRYYTDARAVIEGIVREDPASLLLRHLELAPYLRLYQRM